MNEWMINNNNKNNKNYTNIIKHISYLTHMNMNNERGEHVLIYLKNKVELMIICVFYLLSSHTLMAYIQRCTSKFDLIHAICI